MKINFIYANHVNRERIEDLKFLQKLRVKTSGVDSNALAMGDSSESNNNVKINVSL